MDCKLMCCYASHSWKMTGCWQAKHLRMGTQAATVTTGTPLLTYASRASHNHSTYNPLLQLEIQIFHVQSFGDPHLPHSEPCRITSPTPRTLEILISHTQSFGDLHPHTQNHAYCGLTFQKMAISFQHHGLGDCLGSGVVVYVLRLGRKTRFSCMFGGNSLPFLEKEPNLLQLC